MPLDEILYCKVGRLSRFENCCGGRSSVVGHGSTSSSHEHMIKRLKKRVVSLWRSQTRPALGCRLGN
ncbi:hypothetical protein AGR4C_Lc90196 [Agrobacterium tumefaciens str. Kerr 14]|uniref:Uncharacterized protein n=1 Tax=Agrobacterium tumefaciens str. Kerr 14 TaxID=1183424 RepID=A0A1S7S7Z4_AGRTU|nr:hypothetical protein AGR4C_Lc90196 [Agrobacterium tumefaciens str. Kerr 14]